LCYKLYQTDNQKASKITERLYAKILSPFAEAEKTFIGESIFGFSLLDYLNETDDTASIWCEICALK
jgi:hypothetical protein